MTMKTVAPWGEIRAEMARARASTGDIATKLGLSYGRFSTLLNSDEQTDPKPEFVERVMNAIHEVAGKKGRRG